ncbi:MAG: hypothetical protein IKV09_05070 [Alistipes sp.]|nr:hypothetical protein [Alistipes sp.]
MGGCIEQSYEIVRKYNFAFGSDNTLLQAWALGADIHCTDYPTHLKRYAKRHIKWLKTK